LVFAERALPLKKHVYRSVNWNLEAIKTPLNELSFCELHHHPTSFRITATAAASHDAGCAFSIAWMGRKGEKLADFVFVRLYRGGIDGDFRKIA
jgi:hypothetical protein